MKKMYLFLIVLIIIAGKTYAQTAFTTGNLVVYTVGNGTDTLTSAPFPVTINEYTIGGSFVRGHALPIAVSGSNKRIVASGTATSEGEMTTSVDGKFLLVPGYDTFPDPAGTKIANSLSTSVNRVVGIFSAAGALDATTALTDAYSGNNIRGVASTDGTNIWLAGTGSSSGSAGVRYTTKGSTTSTKLSTTVTNIRTVNIFNNQLYSSSSSSTFLGVCQDGTGLPTTTGQTITLLPGFPTTAGPSTYAFSIKPTTGDVIFAADDNATASGGGIQKWTFNGTTWSLAYTLTTGLTAGIRGLVVDWSGANPVIYATTADDLPNANKIVTVTDTNNPGAAITTLATSTAKYTAFRGIAFAPSNSITPVTLTSFNAFTVSAGVQLEWATSQEINSKYFEVEKSTDGTHFSAINTISASGNSSIAHNYQVIDKNPSAINYYRLKTIDANGNFSYSNVITIKYAVTFSIYPNPAKNIVSISHPASVNARLLVTDMQGRKIETLNINAGLTLSHLSLSWFSKGQYILNYIDNGISSVKVLVKE